MNGLFRLLGCLVALLIGAFTLGLMLLAAPFLYLWAALTGQPPRVFYRRTGAAPPPPTPDPERSRAYSAETPPGEQIIDIEAVEVRTEPCGLEDRSPQSESGGEEK